MQLFTIGLVAARTPDGTPKLDAHDQPIPTYDQSGRRRLRARVHGMELGVHLRFARRTAASATPAGRCRTRSCRCSCSPRSTTTGAKRLLTYPNAVKSVAAGGPDRRAGSRRCARQHLQSSERRAVHRPPADPAARHEQSVACVRRARERRVRRRRHGPARQSRPRSCARSFSTRRHVRLRAPRTPAPASSRSRCCGSHSSGAPTTAEPRTACTSTSTPRWTSGRGRCRRPPCSTSTVPSTRRPARSRTWGWSRRSCRSRPSTRTRWSRTTSTRRSFFRNSRSNVTNENVVVIDIEEEVALAADPAALVERIAEKLLASQISDTLRAKRSSRSRGSRRRTRRSASPKRSG